MDISSPALEYGSTLHRAMEGQDIMETREEMEDQTRDMLDAHLSHYEEYAKRLKFTALDIPEHEYNMVLKHPVTGEPFPVPFYGIVDRQLKKEDGKPRGFVDFKTSSQEWGQAKLDSTKQFTWYCLADWQESGVFPEDMFMLNFVKDQLKPYARVKRVNRSVDQCAEVFEEAVGLYNKCVVNSDSVEKVCARSFFCPYSS